MKRMIITSAKLCMILGTVLCSVCAPAAAADYGITLDNTTKYSGHKVRELDLSQKDKASLWFKVPLNNAGTTYFAAEGSYLFDYEKKYDQKANTTHILDLNLFKFNMTDAMPQGRTLNLAAGRYQTADLTGAVFAQYCDGGHVQYNSGTSIIKAFGGYTGFLNAHNVTMLNGKRSSFKFDNDKKYDFASPYFILNYSVTLPNIIAQQTVSLEFFSMLGVDGTNGNNSGNNRLYATLAFNGPIASNLFYLASTTFGIEEDGKDPVQVGNLSKASLTLYPAKILSLTAAALYASGDHGKLSPFKGFTSGTACYALSDPEYTSLIKAGLSASLKPVRSLLFGAGADAVFWCKNETNNTTKSFYGDDAVSYAGFQWFVSANWQVFSDLKLGANAYHFFADKEAQVNSGLVLKAVLAL